MLGSLMGESLDKALWTDADFALMGWHDATVHAIAFNADDDHAELVLDVDYIVRWIDPQPPSKYFSFLVAPATLVFENVWSLEGNVRAHHTTLETADLHRLEPEMIGSATSACGPGGSRVTTLS